MGTMKMRWLQERVLWLFLVTVMMLAVLEYLYGCFLHTPVGTTVKVSQGKQYSPPVTSKKLPKSQKRLSKHTSTNVPLPFCNTPQDLGPVTPNISALERDRRMFPDVKLGGIYVPPDCQSRHKVAIIVPYRDRAQQLSIFLNYMHEFLMRQKIEYGIFIVEQYGKGAFNRAKLMNVGFEESRRRHRSRWRCCIYHDVDLLPLDSRNLYSCPTQPRHMSVAVDTFNFKLPFQELFGGVSALTVDQFLKVNGYSNKYWGWGGEDNDMYHRLKNNGYHIARYKTSIARYLMLKHNKSSPNPKRYQILKHVSEAYKHDGLSNLDYNLIEVRENQVCTHLVADIGK